MDSAVAIRSTSAAGGSAGGTAGGAAALAHRPPPAHLGHGLSQGVASLAEGVAAGITGVVRAPIQVRRRFGFSLVHEGLHGERWRLCRASRARPSTSPSGSLLSYSRQLSCPTIRFPPTAAGLQQRQRRAGRPGSRLAGRCGLASQVGFGGLCP